MSLLNPEEGGSPGMFKSFLDGVTQKEPTKSMEIGSMLHQLILEPDKFRVDTELNLPSETIVNIYKHLLAELQMGFSSEVSPVLEDYREKLINIGRLYYAANWKDDTLFSKIKEGDKYWKFLAINSDKVVLDKATYGTLTGMVSSIHQNPKLKSLLIAKNIPNTQILTEKELFWDEEVDGTTIPCKSKLDILLLNDAKKTFSIMDFKTTSVGAHDFKNIFDSRFIYRQLAFYEAACKANYPEYSPGTHYVIHGHTQGTNDVTLFSVSSEYINKGTDLYKDLLRRYSWHKTKNNWVHNREYYQNNFVFYLTTD